MNRWDLRALRRIEAIKLRNLRNAEPRQRRSIAGPSRHGQGLDDRACTSRFVVWGRRDALAGLAPCDWCCASA